MLTRILGMLWLSWLWLPSLPGQDWSTYTTAMPVVDNHIPVYLGIDSNYLDATAAIYQVGEHDIEVALLPNPFRSTLQIEISVPEPLRMGYRVYDLAGNLVWTRDLFDVIPGTHTDVLAVEAWPRGVYFLQLLVEQDGEVNGYYKFRLMHL